MNDHVLRNLLSQRSPWRRVSDWEESDPDLRAAAELPLSYEPNPLADIRAPGLYVFRGPRRVGKSLEVKRAISSLLRSGIDPKLVLYCSCDGFSKQDLRRVVAQGHNLTRTLAAPRYWFFDEVTAVEGWSDIVKDLRDQDVDFREACVVLTGSSARDLQSAQKNLAGRRGGVTDSDRLLLPMGFRDFCRSVDAQFMNLPDPRVHPRDFRTRQAEEAMYELDPWASELTDMWGLYLNYGGFPRAVGEFVKNGDVSESFITDLWDIVAGDALQASGMSEVQVAALLARLDENLCSSVNATSVATDIGLADHKAAQARIADLVAAFLAWQCHRREGGTPKLAAQSKLYFTDPLLAQLPHRRNASYTRRDDSQLHEQQIGLALLRAVSEQATPTAFIQGDRVMHERHGSRESEIDFVGPDFGPPFECKYTDKNWKREAQTMEAQYGEGVMVTRSPFVVGEDEPVWAVPAGIAGWLLSDRP